MTDTTSLPEEFALLQRELSRLTDQRSPQGRVFPWAGVLGLTVLTLLCGYRSLSAIYRFGDTHPELWPQLQLQLRRRPSAPTLSRLLRLVSGGELRQARLRFAVELACRGAVAWAWWPWTGKPGVGCGKVVSSCGYGICSARRARWPWIRWR